MVMVALIVVVLVLTPTLIYETGPHPHRLHTMIAGNAGSYISAGVPFYVEEISPSCNTEFLYIQVNTSVRPISSTIPLEFEVRVLGISENGNVVLFLSLYLTSIRYNNISIPVSPVHEHSYYGIQQIYYYQISGTSVNISSLSNLQLNGKLGIYSHFGPFFELQHCLSINS